MQLTLCRIKKIKDYSRKKKASKGFSLVFTLGILVVVATASLLVSSNLGFNSAMQSKSENKEVAYYIAEAGIQNGYFMLDRNKDWRGELSKTFAGGTYAVLVEQPDPYENIRVLSIAKYKDSKVQIDRFIEPIVKLPIIRTIGGTGVAGKATGPGNGGQLNSPDGLYPDGINLYIADSGNHRIAKINLNTMALTNVAGKPGSSGEADGNNARFNTPGGVTMDLVGNLYVADTKNHAIRKIDTGGNVSTLTRIGAVGGAGHKDGTHASNAKLHEPVGIAIDNLGNIYFSNSKNDRIREIKNWGDGNISSAVINGLNNPRQLAFDKDYLWLYIADKNNNMIKRFKPSVGEISMEVVAGIGAAGFSGDGASAMLAKLKAPGGVGVDGDGNVFIADTDNNRIRQIDLAGIISTIVGTGVAGYNGDMIPPIDADLKNVVSVVSRSSGINIIISDQNNNRVREITDKY